MPKSNKRMLFLANKAIRLAIMAIIISIIAIIISIIVSYPSWKPYFYDPGPIYSSQSDQKLKTVLDISGITKNLTKYYEFDVTEPAFDLMVDANRYFGSGSFKFFKNFKRKMYISLLKDILSRNEDKIEYDIDEEAKIIFIRPKS